MGQSCLMPPGGLGRNEGMSRDLPDSLGNQERVWGSIRSGEGASSSCGSAVVQRE